MCCMLYVIYYDPPVRSCEVCSLPDTGRREEVTPVISPHFFEVTNSPVVLATNQPETTFTTYTPSLLVTTRYKYFSCIVRAPSSIYIMRQPRASNTAGFASPCALPSVKSSSATTVSAPRFRLRVPNRANHWYGAARMTASPPPESATTEAPEEDGLPMSVILDENIAEFCSIDPATGKRAEMNVREKEALFLDAAQAYFRGETVLSDAEFDALKEELTWQGSDVVSLGRDEIRFLDAARAYERGEVMMGDVEFDALKKKLQQQGSPVAILRGPRCSIQRKLTFSDCIPDKKRTFALYLPAGIFAGLAWLSLSYEFTPLHNVDPVLSLILGSPIIYFLAKAFTSIIVPNPQILVGDCPSCGRRTHVLFGNVLNIEGFKDEAIVNCDKCKAELRVEKDASRMVLVKEGKK